MSKEKKTELLALTIPALVTVVVALISLAGTILTLLFSFPPFARLFDPTPTGTVIPSSSTDLAVKTFTVEPTFIPTDVPPTFTLVPATELVAGTNAPPTLPVGMQVSLVANQTRGKAPLKVRLSTKESYYRDASGTVFPCGACNYTWQVRQGSEIIYGPENGQASFEFTFRNRGNYFVTVVVCRSHSTDCGSNGSLVVAE